MSVEPTEMSNIKFFNSTANFASGARHEANTMRCFAAVALPDILKSELDARFTTCLYYVSKDELTFENFCERRTTREHHAVLCGGKF